MCNYIRDNICSIENNICPFMYWCNKEMRWRPNKRMPDICKVAERYNNANGVYAVVSHYNNWLYIQVDKSTTIKRRNPYNYIPTSVDLCKDKNGEYQIIIKENDRK